MKTSFQDPISPVGSIVRMRYRRAGSISSNLLLRLAMCAPGTPEANRLLRLLRLLANRAARQNRHSPKAPHRRD